LIGLVSWQMGAYLDHMHCTEDIGTVAMEAFERIEVDLQ
jgi:hypothetical protein